MSYKLLRSTCYLLFATSYFFIASPCFAKEKIIRIGCAAPFTGDQAKIGLDMLNGVKLAIKQANEKGNVIPGYKLEVYPLDDQHNPTQAVNAAKKFVADKRVIAVVGHLNSSCTKPASAIYYQARIVSITPASTNPDISKQGFDTFFRICATDDVQGPAAARYGVKKLNAKRVYIIDDKTTYGKGLADEFEKEIRKLGVKVLGHEGITQGDKDFSPLLTKIKAMNPDLLFFGGIYPEAALMIKQARDLGLAAQFMGGDGMCDPIYILLATPRAAEGTVITMVGAEMKQVPTAREFIKAYEAEYGEVGLYSAYAYDCANIIIEAIKRAGLPDRKALLKEVKNTKDYQGVIGVTNFDEKGDNLNKFIGVFQVKDGKFVYIGPAD